MINDETSKKITGEAIKATRADVIALRIQALEWVQGQIQDLILDNVTTDWPIYNYE
jgi:hypothetical protein